MSRNGSVEPALARMQRAPIARVLTGATGSCLCSECSSIFIDFVPSPSCSNSGGQHLPSRCSDPHCPETSRLGSEHSALLNGCTVTAARRKQCKLWKIGGSANNPAEWWAFPDAGSVLEGITLPPELVGYTLDGLTLNVRVAVRGGAVAVRGGAWRCVAVRGGAWRCVAVRGGAGRCGAVCGCAWLCVADGE
jgi:hypothetical protein